MNIHRLFSIILLICTLLSACTPAATSTAAPPTTTAEIMTPTLALTTFSSKVFELPMSVSFGSDWHVSDDFTDLVTVAGKQKAWEVGFNIVTSAQMADPADGHLVPFPEDFVASLQADPDFKVDQITPVTIDGIEGIQIDATPVWKSAAANKKPFLSLHSTGWNLINDAERWRFIYLGDVNGERLLIMLIAPADQFDAAAEQAQEVLNTVVFAK